MRVVGRVAVLPLAVKWSDLGSFNAFFDEFTRDERATSSLTAGFCLTRPATCSTRTGESWRQGRACTMEAKAFWSTRRTKVFADTPRPAGVIRTQYIATDTYEMSKMQKTIHKKGINDPGVWNSDNS